LRKLENFIRFHGFVLKVIRELAPGGMGDILLCEEVSSKGKFVLKSKRSIDISPTIVRSYTDFINDPNFKRFNDEVVAYVQLIHPNIVDFYGFEVVNGIPRILLSFVDGGTLADWISNGKALNLKTAMKILIQIATGLQFAHEHGLIHRDLKPSNVLMKEKPDNSFISKISDFGIVKISAGNTTSDVTDLQDDSGGIYTDAIGTPGYGSPEQFHLVSGKVDKNTDLFSFGIIATEMLSGGEYPKIISLV
jgi:serine/threonine protein kinase